MDAVNALTRELVAVPEADAETVAGDRLERWLRTETDAAVTRDATGNVIARRAGDSPSLALIGHHDVVPPATGQVADGEHTFTERDGRFYGRGTADMKGAVAAMAVAFRDADPDAALVFASFVGEEIGGEGARAAIEDGFEPAYAIVGEGSTGYSAPGLTDVVVAHRGRRASTLTAPGEAAHASEPEHGDNAIYHACDAIAGVRDLDAPTATVLGHELTGTVTVTEIDGGTAWNVIPDTCTITIDERTVPDARADLEAVATAAGVDWTVDQDLPPMACDDPGYADAVREIATTVQDTVPEQVTKPHATDAGWLAQAGTTCLVCGPAEPGEAHTDDESVAIAVLDRCYQLYRDLADGWPPTGLASE
ncbi:MAG: M20 family metallopeptidase [Halobacteriaceae archaeon]